MKKNVMAGLVAAGLIIAGGTGFALENAKVKAQNTSYSMQQRMGNVQMMKSVSTDGTQKQNDQSTFEQMLPYMKKMHPNLSDDQLKALYDKMMGPNGACSNGQGMMGTTNNSGQGMMSTTNNNL